MTQHFVLRSYSARAQEGTFAPSSLQRFTKKLTQHTTHLRRNALLALAIMGIVSTLALAPAPEAFAQTSATPFTWKNVNIQGMGYVTGMVIQEKAPYNRYVRTDVGGVYRYDGTSATWVNLSDKYSRNQNEISDVESIAVDAVNVNRIWKAAPLGRALAPNGSDIEFKGEVHVSDDRGATWKPTGLASKNVMMEGNGEFRGMAGERLLIDPFDAERVYFGSRKQGLWVRSGGQWTQAAGIPAGAEDPGITFVVADRSAGALNGRAKTLYAGVYNSGVWRSDDGGANWSPAVGSPNRYPLRAAVSPAGALFVNFGGDEGGEWKKQRIGGGAWRFSGGVWKDMRPGNTGTFTGVSIDPTNAKNVVISRGSGRVIFRSNDGGESWSEVAKTVIGQEPAYYPKPRASNYNAYVGEWGNAALVFDPGSPGAVWQTNGFGVITTNGIFAPSVTWSWAMNGLEELVVRMVKAPPLQTIPGTNEPGAELVSAVADMIGFRHAKADTVPTTTLGPIDYVAGGNSIDYVGQQPQYMAYVGWDQDKGGWWAVRTGYSTDNGKTFTPFANTSPGSGGMIALSATNPDNMVWAPTRWAKPQYTLDRGKTWQKALLTDGTELPASWKLQNEWWKGQVLVADRVEANRFYFFDGDRFYTSSDSGKTWKWNGKSGQAIGFAPFWTLDTNIVVNPEKAGQVFMTFAPNSNQFESFKMFRSDDYGVTFKPVTTADSVNYLAFGRGDATGAPYMFIHGRVGNATKDGVYRSKDSGATWELVSSPDENQHGKITTMAADLLKKNRVYIGTGGRGIFVGTGESVAQGNVRAVNFGGGAAGNYKADEGFNGGNTFITTKTIDRGAVEQPAPEAVYQSERYGTSFTYRSPVLAEGRRYLVRLHFAEIYWGIEGLGGTGTGVGTRVFDVTISNLREPGKKVLSNFDIFKEAGGANKAIVREFEAFSDGTGNLNFKFEATANSPDRNAKVSGIELIELGF
jgi:xyloglucan-specific exo-beta-1,4-glucanase